MARLVEEKINGDIAAAYLPSQIGIVLMNHGCPHKAKGFTSGITESQALYDLVRDKLINRYPLISVGWLNHDTPLIEWTLPNAEQAANNLIQLGAKVVIFMHNCCVCNFRQLVSCTLAGLKSLAKKCKFKL